MVAQKEPPRPYWHVDAKWVFGLSFTFLLFVTTILHTLSVLTSPQVAIPTATYIVATQFSKDGLEDEVEVQQAKQEFLASGQDKFYPFGKEQDVYLTAQDIQTLSPKDIRLKIFRQVVEPVYQQQVDPDTLKQYGFLSLLNHTTHRTLRRFFIFSLPPLFLTLTGLVFFSYRYGRLVSPALPLLFFGALPSLFFWLVTHTTPPPGDSGPLSFIPPETLANVVGPISLLFNIYFFLGLTLIAAAIVIKLSLTFTQKKS